MCFDQNLCTACIIVYLTYALSWSLQNNAYTKYLVQKYIAKYVVYCGLWHSWNMFSFPSQHNNNLNVKIIYADESSEVIEVFNADKQLFMLYSIDHRESKLTEHLIYNTEFCDDARIGFAKFLAKRSADKKISRVLFIKNSTTIPEWGSFDKSVQSDSYTIAEVIL